ncbi:MAG: O-antigen ligase family protein [Streptomyces sp.]|uniref:O-antigen ligase family protein n=1 Tax=Streptomyces sp. TaxID=1931 RepID=UPI003D6C15A9
MTSPVLGLSAVRERESGAPDVTGVLVLGACAGWALITAAGRDARPEGVLLAVLAVGAGYACGRITGSLLPVGAGTLAALGGLCLGLFGPQSSRALPGALEFSGPAGRTGVTAALLTLAVGAACCAAWATTARPVRLALRLLAAGTVVAALLVGTPAGFGAALAVLLCSLAAGRLRRRLWWLATLALVAAAVMGLTWAVAQGVLPAGLASALEGQLTEHRVALWQDALTVTREHPLFGSGPDTFGDLSPANQADIRSDGRPHSAPLQLAAEQGLPGLALLAAVYGWLLLALWASPRPTPVVLTAGAALSALAALASIGNALSFTQVTAGAGLLAGIACARQLS